jgi:hypothetical protein
MLQISLTLKKLLTQTCPSQPGISQKISSYAASALPYVCLMAECFGTAGPVTTNNLWCIYEAITWTTMFVIAGVCALTIRSNIKKMDATVNDLSDAKILSNGLILVSLVYVPYMILVNIPMYKQAYIDAGGADGDYLTFSDGLPDVSSCHSQSFDWDKWADDAGWMLGYFGPAVWTSIWLMKAPCVGDFKEEGGNYLCNNKPTLMLASLL